MLGGFADEPKVELSNLESNLVDKVVQIPRHRWKFVNDLNSRFYFINDDYRYVLYVSGGIVYSLRMQSESVSTEVIEIKPNEKLKKYCDSLLEDVRLADRIAKDKFLMKLDENLTSVINFEPRSREE